MQTQKVNDAEIKPIKHTLPDITDLKGLDVFPTPFFSMFIASKRKSGKTVLIHNLVRMLAMRGDKRQNPPVRTHVIIFSGTIKKDPVYIHLINWLEKKDYSVIAFDDIMDENGNDRIIELIETLKQFEDDQDNYLIIIDDLSCYLKEPSIALLLKNGRHLRTRVILSSQYYNDLNKSARANIDYYILFKNISQDKIDEIFVNCDISVPQEKFNAAYRDAVSTPYSFLMICKNEDELRKNLNEKYVL